MKRAERVAQIMCITTILISVIILIYLSGSLDDVVTPVETTVAIEFTTTTETTELPIIVESSVETTAPSETMTFPATEQVNDEIVETTPEKVSDDFTPYVSLTDEEMWLLGQVLHLEAGGESYECRQGVASVIVNRMTTQGASLHDIIYAEGQFSVVDAIGIASPSESTYQAGDSVFKNGPSLPVCVTYFRADYYHDFEYLGIYPYCQIDNTYFSHDLDYCHLEGGCSYEQK